MLYSKSLFSDCEIFDCRVDENFLGKDENGCEITINLKKGKYLSVSDRQRKPVLQSNI